ncbi:Processing alpha glucosidase I [Thecaphora frezii]
MALSKRPAWRLLALCLLVTLVASSVRAFGGGDYDGLDLESNDDFDDRTRQLLAAPEVSAVRKEAYASMLWGSYRPQIYFGLRPKLPETLLTGLAWFGVNDYSGLQKIRHQCSDQDGMRGYGWKYHDGRTFGIQEINDVQNNYRLETSFLKVDTANPSGGSWGARISGTVMDPAKPAKLALFWYNALEGLGDILSLETDEDEEGLKSQQSIKLGGSAQGLGNFTLRIEEPSHRDGNANVDGNLAPTDGNHAEEYRTTSGRTHFFGKRVPGEMAWKGKEILQNDVVQSIQSLARDYPTHDMPAPWLSIQLSDYVEPGSNFFAFQKTFTGNFTFDVFFDSAATPRGELLTSAGLTQGLRASREAYDARFLRAFGLEANASTSASEIDFARDLTSSLVGGIGYSYGQSIVDRTFVHEYDVGSGAMDVDLQGFEDPQLTEPAELLTATPCRSVFPRGFYWDEGFHLTHIGVWDNDLSLEILRSWFKLIDANGWVAREQILGDEARSRVPERFQTQYPAYANPPTLILAVATYIDRLMQRAEAAGMGSLSLGSQQQLQESFVGGGDGALASLESVPLSDKHLSSPLLGQAFLQEIYPQLRRHYRWFRRTQRGEIKEWERDVSVRGEAYRWRGRTKDHVLTSGLDDYPRAAVPHTGELHLDLMSWMGSFAHTMTKIARAIGQEDDAEEFQDHYEGILANLDDLHWNEREQMYCDASVNERDESYFVCHKGYVSLFPLLLELLPVDSPKVSAILELMRDPEHLWSDYGLRSLSLQDEYFGKGENYWRGPIWIQMSYLALRALKSKYAATPGPYQQRAQQIYDELRQNVITNVQREYRRTGYVYEQYNPIDGRGQRGHPFTGWTSTVALMMAQIY